MSPPHQSHLGPRTPSRAAIGVAVRSLRQVAHLTLRDLSTLGGMTEASLSRTENALRDLSFSEADVLCHCTGIPLQEFVALTLSLDARGASKVVSSAELATTRVSSLLHDAVERLRAQLPSSD